MDSRPPVLAPQIINSKKKKMLSVVAEWMPNIHIKGLKSLD